MNLYFKIGEKSWICVSNCYDWNDAVNRVKLWNLKDMQCINEEDFRKLKENLVLTF